MWLRAYHTSMYETVPALLEPAVRTAAFPDGSVDVFARIRDAEGERLSKAAFGERLTGARSREFRLTDRSVEPGGQAVTAARQAHALGDEVRLDGCLDHPRLSFPFETHSHGEPSRVSVHQFDDGDLVYASVSDDVAGWTLEALETVPVADAYVCGNWASVDGMTEAIRALAGRLDGAVFVFDPGDLTAAPPAGIRDCCVALGALDDRLPVVASLNDRELTAVADAFAVEADPAAVRPEAGVSGVVVHEADAATAAAREVDGEVAVPNVDLDETVRNTGGGDRFNAGLAHGLAACARGDVAADSTGGHWADDGYGIAEGLGAALALGNLCASHYVATGETGSAAELAAFASEHGPP